MACERKGIRNLKCCREASNPRTTRRVKAHSGLLTEDILMLDLNPVSRMAGSKLSTVSRPIGGARWIERFCVNPCRHNDALF